MSRLDAPDSPPAPAVARPPLLTEAFAAWAAGFPERSHRLGLSRFGWFVLFAVPFAVVMTATQLLPDVSGMGTHQQLGLPPCGFLEYTHIPCPGCGLTTSFSHMVRLQFVGAAHANPFGIMLFLVTFFTMPVALIGFVKGLPVLDTLEALHAEKWAILLSLTSMLVWAVRVAHLLAA